MANKATVKISAATLNALKQLVFSSQEGVDLSSIINDIAGKEDNAQRDEVAVNIALAFKGIVPKIDSETVRYESLNDWNKSYYTCTFEHYSLILDRVYYTTTKFKMKDGVWENVTKEPEHNSCSLEDWYDKPTNIEEFMTKCAKDEKQA